MRHASLKTTMDYYANIDAAVEEAIWGDSRNTSCNTSPESSESVAGKNDVNAYQNDTNSPSTN